MKKDLISIIVPVYNTEPYLQRCVDSLLAQDYPDTEIILVDDGATDRSGQICDVYASAYENVNVIHKKNGGLSDARNEGMRIARGSYLSFVDSDDYVRPSFIRVLKDTLDRSACRISKCSMQEAYEIMETGTVKAGELVIYSAEEYLENIDRMNAGFSVCNKLFARELFDGIMFPKGRLHEDVAVIYRLAAAAGRIAAVDQKLYCYCSNDDSITRSRMKPERLDDLDFREDLCEFCMRQGWKKAAEKAGEHLLGRILEALRYSEAEVDRYGEYRERLVKIRRRYVRNILLPGNRSLRQKAAVIYHFYMQP